MDGWPTSIEPSRFAEDLLDIGAISLDELEIHWPRTRDTELPVIRDRSSGVILLSAQPDLEKHYGEKSIGLKPEAEVSTLNGVVTLPRRDGDLERRLTQTGSLARNKDVCDFGTGRGLYLDEILKVARSACGVELREDMRTFISARLGEQASLSASLQGMTNQFDLVTLFHVLEHIPNQIDILEQIREALRPGGQVFIEVPHARDYLAMDMALEDYRNFIYWSEHLVLHTRDSLNKLLQATGFGEIRIEGLQRYGYANHLGWLRHARPGGHEWLKEHSTKDLDKAYARMLAERDATDTLIAVATKPD